MSVGVPMANPALAAFVSHLAGEEVLAQVILCRAGSGFELRHVADRQAAEAALRIVPTDELRALARLTAAGEFRPLKSAPNLRSGWRAVVKDASGLGFALDQLYPGAVADWFAACGEAPPVTSFRQFTLRQSGIYRITTTLDDALGARVIRECCDAARCLKRRLWSIAGLAADPASGKSIIPCLEPCAVLLDRAREAVRREPELPRND